MNTQEYLAALRAKLNVTSDYGLSKALGVSRQASGRWSKGINGFDDEVCLRVAHILEIDVEKVVLDMYHERAKSEEMRIVWKRISEKFSTSFNYPVLRANPRQALRLAR